VPTGTQVLDWIVPNEWNVQDAYVADADGRRIIDFAESKLQVAGYSVQWTPYGALREYTSRDNSDFVVPEAMVDSLETVWEIFCVLQHNRCFVNLSSYGEPQLGNRGLYGSLGGHSDIKQAQLAIFGCSISQTPSTAWCRS
jgi:aminopeptidase-like protein